MWKNEIKKKKKGARSIEAHVEAQSCHKLKICIFADQALHCPAKSQPNPHLITSIKRRQLFSEQWFAVSELLGKQYGMNTLSRVSWTFAFLRLEFIVSLEVSVSSEAQQYTSYWEKMLWGKGKQETIFILQRFQIFFLFAVWIAEDKQSAFLPLKATCATDTLEMTCAP